MHILIIYHYASSPYHGGGGVRSYYLAREWIKKNHKVTIVTATYAHTRIKNPVYKNRITKEGIDGINYIWLKTCKYKGQGIGRIFNILGFMMGLYSIIPMLIRENPDVVVASSVYPLDNFPANKIARKAEAIYVFELHDLWPLTPLEIGGYSKYHPFIKIMQYAENFTYKNVDRVISILPCAEEYMIAHGLSENKFTHIPNGISLDEMNNLEQLDYNVKCKIPRNKFIVGYTGTIGNANSINTIINAASIIGEINDEICFVLIGEGAEKKNIMLLINKLKLDNCLILDAIPKNQVQSVILLFDIAVIAWRDRPLLYKYGISPNKIFDYMYAGRPVIQAVNAGNDIIKDANCGLKVPPEDPQALADGIIKMYKMPKRERELLGANGQKYVLRNHAFDILAKKFIDAIKVG